MGPFFESGDGEAEVFGKFGGVGGGFVGCGMDESEFVGVEGEALDERALVLVFAVLEVAFEFGEEDFFAAVKGVDGEGVAHGFEMDADLMAATGDGEDFHEGDAGEALDGDPFGAGLFGFVAADDHAEFVVGVGADGEIDGAGFLEGCAADEGEVFLGDGAVAELEGEVAEGFVGAGEDDEAGGVGVDAVNEQGFLAGELGIGGEEVKEALGASTSGDDGEAGGFVDGDEGGVEVDDLVEGRFFHERFCTRE